MRLPSTDVRPNLAITAESSGSHTEPLSPCQLPVASYHETPLARPLFVPVSRIHKLQAIKTKIYRAFHQSLQRNTHQDTSPPLAQSRGLCSHHNCHCAICRHGSRQPVPLVRAISALHLLLCLLTRVYSSDQATCYLSCSCSRHGVVAVRLTSERPGSVTTLSKDI